MLGADFQCERLWTGLDWKRNFNAPHMRNALFFGYFRAKPSRYVE
jgi:hypothetical protein